MYNHKILQAINTPCLVLKPVESDFVVIDVNEAFLKATSNRRENLVGRRTKESFPRNNGSGSIDQERFIHVLKKVVTTGKKSKIKSWRFDVPMNGKLKEKYWTVRNIPILDEEGRLEVVVHSITDITREIKAKRRKDRILQKLQLDRERYQHFIEGNSDGLYSLDLEGKFTSANKGLVKIAGVPLSKLLQMSFYSFCHPDHRDLIDFHFKKTINGQPTVFEARCITADNHEMLLEVNLVPIKVQNVITGAYGIAKDRTAVWEAEQVVIKKDSFLKANASFISGLFEKGLDDATLEKAFASVGKAMGVDRMYYFGVHSGPIEGDLQISAQLEWTSGWVPNKKDGDKMKNMDLLLFQQAMPLLPDKPFATFTREIYNEQLRQLFEEYLIKSLLILPVFVRENLYGFIGFDDCKTERIWTEEEILFLQSLARNLTTALEKRAAEEELTLKETVLAQSEKKFRALVQEGSDMLAILDINGTYKFVSDSIFSILGFKPDDLIGKNPFDFIHPEDVDKVQSSFEELGLVKQIKMALRYQDRSGEWRWIETKAINMLGDPAVVGIVLNSRDITESRNALEKIKKQNMILKEIAWDQSHLVRAPVARIQGLLEAMEMDEMVHPNGIEFFRLLQDSADELDAIIRDIVIKTEEMGN